MGIIGSYVMWTLPLNSGGHQASVLEQVEHLDPIDGSA
jgi:hypothetical protein